MLTNNIVDKYYKVLKNKGLNLEVNVPKSMAEKDKGDGWFTWHPVVSSVDDKEIEEIERKYGIKLPSVYIDFIKNKQFLDIQVGGYTLFGVNENNTLEKLLKIFPENVVSLGYIPLGQINDEDFIALDTNTETVVLLGYDDYKLKKILFENFNDLISDLNKKIDMQFT